MFGQTSLKKYRQIVCSDLRFVWIQQGTDKSPMVGGMIGKVEQDVFARHATFTAAHEGKMNGVRQLCFGPTARQG